MMYYKFGTEEIEAVRTNWFLGLFANTMAYGGKFHSKEPFELSRQTQLEEYIHLLQQRELKGRFYRLYVWYWIKRLSYKKIPFEMEAKINANEQYILNRPAMNWKNY